MATDTRTGETGSKLDRISVPQYLSMMVDGSLPQDSHLELIAGRLVEQMTKYPPHNYTARQLGIVLKEIVPVTWIISEEKSVTMGRFWRPEPDLAILRGPNDRYRNSDPKAADVCLLIEVADSSYATDRSGKWRAYAAARIPFYWIVNLAKSQIEVYREPTGRGKNASYRQTDIFAVDAEVPVVIDGRDVGRISVKEILP